MLQISPSDVVVKTVCFSVDPVMKFFLAGTKTYFRKLNVGDIFNCFGLGKVAQGNEDFEVGSYVFGNIGTCDINVLD
jgi:NADPH-dependent curcumin reductase CurA